MQQVANFLTMTRVAAIPIIVGLLYLDGAMAAWSALLVFVFAAITDWADGFVARYWKSQSEFGSFLDPIADKLLVAAVLMVLVAQGRVYGGWVMAALIILCREILVSGLREFLAGLRISVPVSKLAKWKTAIQFIAISILILSKNESVFHKFLPQLLVNSPEFFSQIGLYSLAIAAGLTLITGYDYLRAGLSHMDSK